MDPQTVKELGQVLLDIIEKGGGQAIWLLTIHYLAQLAQPLVVVLSLGLLVKLVINSIRALYRDYLTRSGQRFSLLSDQASKDLNKTLKLLETTFATLSPSLRKEFKDLRGWLLKELGESRAWMSTELGKQEKRMMDRIKKIQERHEN